MNKTTADTKQFSRGAQFVEQKFVYELPDSHTLSDVLRPEYWRPVSEKIIRLSVVTCIGGADSIDIDLRCMGSAQGYCVMRIIREAPGMTDATANTECAERHVEYRPGQQWCVIEADGSVLKSGIKVRAEALESLAAIGE